MAEISEEQNEQYLENKIQIYSNDDEKLKHLGQILGNETSRKILQLLIENEMTANEISFASGLSLSLIIHHINKMLQANLVSVSKIINNTKNQPMKYYTAKSGIVILPKEASKKAKQSKHLSLSFKEIMKFAGIGLAGVVSYFFTSMSQITLESNPASEEPNVLISDSLPFVVAIVVVGVGLLVQFALNQNKQRT